jgi:hypothetical protein
LTSNNKSLELLVIAVVLLKIDESAFDTYRDRGAFKHTQHATWIRRKQASKSSPKAGPAASRQKPRTAGGDAIPLRHQTTAIT